MTTKLAKQTSAAAAVDATPAPAAAVLEQPAVATPEAPYGLKKDGTPKKALGRPCGTTKASTTTKAPKKTLQSEKKRGPGRPKGSKNKVHKVEVNNSTKEKVMSKQETAGKKGRGRPKMTRIPVETPKDLVAFITEAKHKLEAGRSAANRVIKSLVEQIVSTTNSTEEKQLITQLHAIKTAIA